MASEQVLRFISQYMAAGKTEEQIRDALRTLNYSDADIDAGFAQWKSNPVLPDRPIVGRFIGQAWEIYKAMFNKFASIYQKMVIKLLIAAAPGLALVLIGWYLDSTNSISQETLEGAGLGLGIIYLIIGVYLLVWTQIALMTTIRNREQSEFNVDQVIENSKPVIGKFFGTSLLTAIMIFAWTLLLIIPGILHAVYYTFSEYIVIDKNISGMDALRLSKRYVKGIWWQVVGSLLGLFAVNILIYMVGSALGLMIGQGAETIYSVVTGVLLWPYGFIYTFLVYEKIKSLKPEIV